MKGRLVVRDFLGPSPYRSLTPFDPRWSSSTTLTGLIIVGVLSEGAFFLNSLIFDDKVLWLADPRLLFYLENRLA